MNQIANTILSQLGGRRFIAMTGAKNFLAGSKGELHFSVPCRVANRVVVTLDANDTYSMEFSRVRGTKVTSVEKCDNVYFDQLCSVFERVTGLATRI